MKIIWVLSILTIFLSSMSIAFACSPVFPIGEFKIDKNIKTPPPERPNFVVTKITRGERVRDNSSCFYLRTLGEISFKAKKTTNNQQGYIFEIIEGKLEKNKIFQTYPVYLKHPKLTKGIYKFDWEDSDSNIQEPFNIKIKVIGVSRSGVKSKPQYLQIYHEGVKIPWWNIWKRLPSSMTQVFESDGF